MERTWKPTTAGILSIVAGGFGVIGGMAIAALTPVARGVWPGPGFSFMWPLAAGVLAIPLVLGIVAIVGGIYALRRRVWGLALAGAICSLFGPWFVLGILAIIFVAMGKGEFE